MKDNIFQTCSPEEAGIPSGTIEEYLRLLSKERLAMHDLLIVRGGKLCFETYWKPFTSTFRHRLYSCSKSIVSTAIGLLIEHGLLSLEDKAVSFFSDKAPKDMNPWLAEMTIRDLLRMATCYEQGASYKPHDPDWEATFFTAQVSHKPGQVFSYCTTATTMLCMIIKRVTGKEFMEYLRPVFDELGISHEAFCVETPCGHEWGGSGVCFTAREFAKYADLCTHYGNYNGRQLLPAGYMREATSKQIDNGIEHSVPDTDEGYGYQFWPMRNGGFAMHGMGGQFALCLPDQDFTLITNAYDELNAKCLGNIFEFFWITIYPELSKDQILVDNCAKEKLDQFCKTLMLPCPEGKKHSPVENIINGKRYFMTRNPLAMRWLSFEFGDEESILRYENNTGEHTLRFGMGKQCDTFFPETHYYGRRIGMPANRSYQAYNSGAWSMSDSLMIYCHIADIHLANLRLAFAFDEDTVTLYARKHAEFFMEEYTGFASGKWES